jgi:hypothetical protein
MKSTVKDLRIVLENALLNDGIMEHALYEYEFEELLEEFKESVSQDNDDFLFAVTTHKNDVTGAVDTAMVVVELTGAVHINESARDVLKATWGADYASNMKKLIPDFALQLHQGDIPINGVKEARGKHPLPGGEGAF